VTIEFTGLRPGEKLIEELFYENEEVGQTSFPKIKRARGPIQDWNSLADKLEELEATLFLNGSDLIRAKINEILPEYSYSSSKPSQEAEQQEEEWQSAERKTA
jgi:FlaA1/EpsC-like NDP-sugar epimerase